MVSFLSCPLFACWLLLLLLLALLVGWSLQIEQRCCVLPLVLVVPTYCFCFFAGHQFFFFFSLPTAASQQTVIYYYYLSFLDGRGLLRLRCTAGTYSELACRRLPTLYRSAGRPARRRLLRTHTYYSRVRRPDGAEGVPRPPPVGVSCLKCEQNIINEQQPPRHKQPTRQCVNCFVTSQYCDDIYY